VDIRDIRLGDLRNFISLTAQQPVLFQGSILDNIALGRPGVSRTEIVDAIRIVGLTELASELPEGLATDIASGGAKLSAGQRQRVALARAVVQDAKIMIFDESTAALDPATEQTVLQGIRYELAGKTRILVTHRLAPLDWVDRVIVLHEGRVQDVYSPAEAIGRKDSVTVAIRE
jgi:ATP-binding cassette subfamily B protein